MSTNYKLILLLLARLLQVTLLFSQEEPANAEYEYYRIRSIAFSGDHETASAEARKLVNKYPEYGDARILLSRIIAWQKDYGTALSTIDTLLISDPENSDALLLRNDIIRWSKGGDLSSTEIIAGYSFDKFAEPYSRFWQVLKAGAGRKSGWGSASVYLNAGNVKTQTDASTVSATEFQIESEAYPKLSSKNYAYLAYAYSPGKYFPRHRAAVEIWQDLPSGWNLSAGLNYYFFDRNIFIAMASVEKYAGKFWFSGKTFFYLKDQGLTLSVYLIARRYLNDDDYFQLIAGTGTAPDEPFDIITDLGRLSANSLRVTYNNKISDRVTIRIGAGFSDEEYAESAWRNRYEGNITFFYSINKK